MTDKLDTIGDSEPDQDSPPDPVKPAKKKKGGACLKDGGKAPKSRLDKKSRGGSCKK